MRSIDLSRVEGFEWDEGSKDKNWLKHKVSNKEAEEVFFNEPFKISYDERHSQKEDRFTILGATGNQRKLTVVFTLRRNNIRIITARAQDRKERRIYEKIKKNSQV